MGHLLNSLRVPVTEPSPDKVDKDGSDILAESEYKGREYKNDSGGSDPIPTAVFGRRRVGYGTYVATF
jgi:hypothetical protein